MKTSKLPPGEPPSSSRRLQPVRQTRSNPPRKNSALNHLGSRDSLSGATAVEQAIDIFPGVKHFADAITALPKELFRHFTLLKEVDAKIFAPEEHLFQLVRDALDTPPPPLHHAPAPARSLKPTSKKAAPGSTSTSSQSSSSRTVALGHASTELPANRSSASSVFDDSNLARRQLFRQTAVKIQEMLNSLEEKNHVISTANDALRKQLNRIEDIWPHLVEEFSDEAKWGSDSHWAYPANRAARALNTQAERTRREGAAHLSAAAQFVAEEAAARSESRKQAVAARKSQKNHPPDSELDDHEAKGKGEPNKKPPSNAKRKTANNAAANNATANNPITSAGSPAGVGLGITGQTALSSSTPAPKRRKVEKASNGGSHTAAAAATVLTNGKNLKAKASESPRTTPAPEQLAAKKRKALPNSTGQSKKRTGLGQSASAATSPGIGACPDTSKPPQASLAPSACGRPAMSKACQSSIVSHVEKLPASATSTSKPDGGVPEAVEHRPAPTQGAGSRGGLNNESTRRQMEAPSAGLGLKGSPIRQQIERAVTPKAATAASYQKEGAARPADEVTMRRELTPSWTAPPITQLLTATKNGRASKPSTPAIGNFPENGSNCNSSVNQNSSRVRSARNSEAPMLPKRSHKKGASAAHAAAVQRALAQAKAGGPLGNMVEDETDVYDPDEPTYCYCERVSFGQMVGCDSDNCKREWFHLECVGLKVAPGKSVKWYCDDCKKHMAASGKKTNGR